MTVLLILLIIASAGMVLFALGRGLFHFSQSHAAAEAGLTAENNLAQNRMMVARVKWQAITIILLVLIGVAAAGAR